MLIPFSINLINPIWGNIYNDIPLLVNLSCELGQIMNRYDFMCVKRVILSNVRRGGGGGGYFLWIINGTLLFLIRNNLSLLFSSAVPPGSGAFQMPTRPSSASASTLRGGRANLRNVSVTFSLFLAWGFFGMTLTTYHRRILVESL